MAENWIKIIKRNEKMFKKKKTFIRFQRDLRNSFENDIQLKNLRKRIEIGNKLWKQLVSERESSGDDEREFSFDGFDDRSHDNSDDRDDRRQRETEAREDSTQECNRIQSLLRSKWKDRIREWTQSRSTTTATTATTTTTATTDAMTETTHTEEGEAREEPKANQKGILRAARLQINKRTLLRIRRAQKLEQMSRFKRCAENKNLEIISKKNENNSNIWSKSKSGHPGFITCAICSATKYYSHVQRRYGVFSCEPCSKFFARFMKEPKNYFCSNSGDCPISESQSEVKCCQTLSSRVPSRVRSRANSRCKACWLKVCLQKFSITEQSRQSIANNFSPKLVAPPLSLVHVGIPEANTSISDPNRIPLPTRLSTNSMVSHTAQSQQSLLMVASALNSNKSDQPMRGPRVKRVCRSAGIVSGLPLATFGSTDDDIDDDSDSLPVDVYLCRRLDDNTTTKDDRMTSPKKHRCNDCSGCRAQDCGRCGHCRDKKKFGGTNRHKQTCRQRKCSNQLFSRHDRQSDAQTTHRTTNND